MLPLSLKTLYDVSKFMGYFPFARANLIDATCLRALDIFLHGVALSDQGFTSAKISRVSLKSQDGLARMGQQTALGSDPQAQAWVICWNE